MESSNLSRNGVSGNSRHSDNLGVNNQSYKIGKSIRKSPMHQPNFGNSKQPQPQPQVYNISKNEFRNIVQQLTGSPVQVPSAPTPPHNPPKHPSMRLQKIRPPPLNPIAKPQTALFPPSTAPFNNPHSPFFARTANSPFPGTPNFSPLPPLTPGDAIWANIAESPISAYMRSLQNSIDFNPRPAQEQQSSGLLPTPNPPMCPSPRSNPPALLPSPTSQFVMPSPSAFMHIPSPRSSFPLPSPGFQYPSPIGSLFSFLSSSQSGILGPGPQLPPSPGILVPQSPSGLFPLSSPRWRDQ